VEFTVTAGNGDSVRVESENWMQAVAKSLGFFDVDLDEVAALNCQRESGSAVRIELPGSNLSFVVRQSDTNVGVQPSDRSSRETWQAAQAEPTGGDLDPNAPRPELVMPDVTLRQDEPRSLGERLFDLSMEIDSMPVDEASSRALKIAASATRAGAGLVALGTLDDPGLVVVAATGPGADQVLQRTIGFGEGIVGMCFDMSDVVAVPDVDATTPHVDVFPGESIVAALCVPVVDDNESIRGVVQLLNPAARPFVQSDVDAAQLVAKTLARTMAAR
jgi:putative methionine-R-sulfoxide reductase with GAF domain